MGTDQSVNAAPPGDRPYGLRDNTVRDLHGYVLRFGHYVCHVSYRFVDRR